MAAAISSSSSSTSPSSSFLQGVSIILLDIEGTTSSMQFVHDVLFPFFCDNVKNFLMKNILDVSTPVKQALEEANNAGITDEHSITTDNVSEMSKILKKMVEKDLKTSSLKHLQGLTWKEGYERGELQGHMFPDVPEALKRWKRDLSIGIYSSGSVAAQKLMFAHSLYGDLEVYIDHHFDTSFPGSKLVCESYSKISGFLGKKSDEILFLTDNLKEAKAAAESGMRAALLDRPGNNIIEEIHPFKVFKTFEDIV